MSKVDEYLRKFDQLVIEQLRDAYINKKNINQLKGVTLNHEPFTHCIISDLIADQNFINELNKEVKSKLKFAQKNNDLYKFHQTADLAKIKSPKITTFRDQVLYGSFLKFLKKMTGIELSSTKIDVTSSKYEYSDYLLCHDDDIHDVNNQGRRFAFIYYLVPSDWNQDGSDGGNLDLFKVNDDLQPNEIVKSIVPKANNLLFFEVSDRSFHQVSEVLTNTKTRYSINGWFHGKINHRPTPLIELIPEPAPYLNIDANLFFDWIVEKYLKPTNQTEIQLKFSDSSEIKLDRIFHAPKYEQISEALTSKDITWKIKGPANKRNYEVADYESLPKIVKDLVQVLTSDYMGLTLSNMTGLALHSSVPKSKNNEVEEDDDDGDYDDDSFEDEDDDDDEDEEDDDDENDEEEGEEEDDEEDSDKSEKESKREPKSNGANKRKLLDTSSDDDEKNKEEGSSSRPCTSSSIIESENLYKKFKTSHVNKKNDQTSFKAIDSKRSPQLDENNETKTEQTQPSTSGAASASALDENNNRCFESNESPKCYFEVRRWKQGSYTLITDDDSEIRTKALDLMVFFKCKLWNLECGGNISYIARDEDSELLTVNPEENCISLVYRDEETLKFTKFVNSRINKLNNNQCFYEISVIYYE